MSKEFDILSAAFDEAILDAKSHNKILKSETASIEIERPVEHSAEPFWSEKNQKYLAESIAELETGGGEKHELVEVE
ncbi:hypothetical protein [Anaerovibrio sp. RM50]|uniref:hypothetical protein n=1 Tax=Anaerovibrio sp. RM50 TaxID=1200557 RepID=UPI00055BAC1C|nr:hypothetical protein [Anaerovibrio sp. RM50]